MASKPMTFGLISADKTSKKTPLRWYRCTLLVDLDEREDEIVQAQNIDKLRLSLLKRFYKTLATENGALIDIFDSNDVLMGSMFCNSKGGVIFNKGSGKGPNYKLSHEFYTVSRTSGKLGRRI